MERLGHRAEVLAQAGRLAAGDGRGARASCSASRPISLRGGGGGREGAAGRRGVEAGLVMPRIDRLGDLALDLDAEMIGQHHVAAARARAPRPWRAPPASAGAVGCVSRP